MKTVEETRHDRLLILKYEYGSVAALAKQLEKSYAQVSQWINRSISTRNGQPRSMNSETARYIESKTNKPKGWMDQPIESDKEKISLSALGLKREDITLDLIEYLELYKQSAEEDQEESRQVLEGTDKAKSKKSGKGQKGSDNQ